MKQILFYLLVAASFSLNGQQTRIFGEVLDMEANPLEYATVALLNAGDSTIEHFSITNTNGKFEISKIPADEYLFQVAFLGYKTFSKLISIPVTGGGNLGAIVLNPVSVELDAVQVSTDRIPLMIKKDTVEYNAAAYKTRPDAVAEDLLKKLPGVEVDHAGNIKAMGEDVNRVLVDGKEFFSNDPKVATKNLPAESINKVQVFDKKTDEAELLGIDDSEYNKTINFVLKEGMKKAIFGDVKGGVGIEDFYQGNAKVFRFTDKHQLAVLGMLNNVNQPGFSFQDYINFNGGIRSMMNSGGASFNIESDNSIPVDFGQTITGNITSGAGGINYSYNLAKNNSLNISYMGNGSRKHDVTNVFTRNFTENSSFEQNSRQNSDGNNTNHLFNIGWRNKAGKKQHFMMNGIVALTKNNSVTNSTTQSLADGDLMNSLDNDTRSNLDQLNTTASGSWLRKGNGNWKLLNIRGSIRYKQNLNKSDWDNLSMLTSETIPFEDSQYSKSDNSLLQFSGKISGLRSLGSEMYFEPSIEAGNEAEKLSREQGQSFSAELPVDSLSPSVDRHYVWIKPGLNFKKYSKKSKINFGLGFELGKQINELNGNDAADKIISTLLPQFSWEYEYRNAQRLGINYSTSIQVPSALQLSPVINTSNPFELYYGNRTLKPEYRHNLNLSWFLFDQFSFTSVFANLYAGYTKDKINETISISENLSQIITLINVPEDYSVSAGFNFATPVRPLGIKISIDLKERWNHGISYVNIIKNINTNLTHKIGLKFDNRKKEKWDVAIGGTFSLTNARYSVQRELNRKYQNYTAYGEIRYTPNQRWHFIAGSDITRYDARGFNEAITIPLVTAEIDFHFLANNRGMLSLEVYDLLNKNTGVRRVSEYNYIREVNSNMIGRYFMLSFKYKLNKFGDGRAGGFKFETEREH